MAQTNPDEDQNRRDDLNESAGQEVGNRTGREIGKKAGQRAGQGATQSGAGAASSGSGSAAGSSAAAGGGSAAAGGGTAAAGGGAAAAGGSAAGGGAAAGATAGSVAPGVGTAIGAVVGAVLGVALGKVFKWIGKATGLSIPVGCFLVLIFLLAPLFAVLLVLNTLFGWLSPGSASAAQGPPGAGLVRDFCLGLKPSGECSTTLKELLESAAAANNMPAGVLAGVLSIEGPHVFGYTNDQVIQYGMNEGGQDPVNATPNECGAVGPMQFLTGSGGTSACPNQAALSLDVWSEYSNAVNEATGLTRATLVQNIMDAVYAGAKKLRTDATAAGVPFDKIIWDRQDVDAAAGAYSGACQVSATFNYCEVVWEYYDNNSNRGISGDATTPSGWPVTGQITTLWCENTGVESCHSGLDIAGPSTSVYAPLSGVIKEAYWAETIDRTCGGVVDIEAYGSPKFYVHLVHLSYETVSQMASRRGETIEAGQKVGDTYPGALPNCSSGAHLHYTIWQDLAGKHVDPMPYTPGADKGDRVSAGGGLWEPQN